MSLAVSLSLLSFIEHTHFSHSSPQKPCQAPVLPVFTGGGVEGRTRWGPPRLLSSLPPLLTACDAAEAACGLAFGSCRVVVIIPYGHRHALFVA